MEEEPEQERDVYIQHSVIQSFGCFPEYTQCWIAGRRAGIDCGKRKAGVVQRHSARLLQSYSLEGEILVERNFG